MDDGDKSLVCLKVVQQLFNKKLPMKPTTFSDTNNIYMVYSIGVDGKSSSIAISLTYGYTDGSTSNVRSP